MLVGYKLKVCSFKHQQMRGIETFYLGILDNFKYCPGFVRESFDNPLKVTERIFDPY